MIVYPDYVFYDQWPFSLAVTATPKFENREVLTTLQNPRSSTILIWLNIASSITVRLAETVRYH